ncbi:MAG: hypothetical protein JNK46_20185 [Methylobacteriaceae bacterium]|nr:hypothetical protein [Methylobacteriaceae bacterium]
MRRFAYAALLTFIAQTAFGQSGSDAREQLLQLYRITISQDICSFPLTDQQADVVTRRTDDLESRLDLTEAEAQKLYDQLEAQMLKQKDAGLCNPDGEWAKAFAALVEAMK